MIVGTVQLLELFTVVNSLPDAIFMPIIIPSRLIVVALGFVFGY